jgi:hypothetical protein
MAITRLQGILDAACASGPKTIVDGRLLLERLAAESGALATALSTMTFVLQSLSDPFNWGWNLFGMAGSLWHIIWSPAIPWLQVACVLIGATYSIKTLYHCWLDDPAQRRRAILGSLPLGSFLWIATAGIIWFFAG